MTAAHEQEFLTRLDQIAIATVDEATDKVDRNIRDVLQLVRTHMGMDVAFVSRFEAGRRIFEWVDAESGETPLLVEGASDPIEQSFCERVIDGRLPELVVDVRQHPNFAALPPTAFVIGAHMSTAIRLRDGTLYGTLCCFSHAPNENLRDRDLRRLRMAASMIARLMDSRWE